MSQGKLLIFVLLVTLGGLYFLSTTLDQQSGSQAQSEPNKDNVTIFEWSRCIAATPCPVQCRTNDTSCYATANDFHNCYDNNKHCQAWDQYFLHQNATAPMPKDYYNCQEECEQPKKNSSSFYRIWKCEFDCAGYKQAHKF